MEQWGEGERTRDLSHFAFPEDKPGRRGWEKLKPFKFEIAKNFGNEKGTDKTFTWSQESLKSEGEKLRFQLCNPNNGNRRQTWMVAVAFFQIGDGILSLKIDQRRVFLWVLTATVPFVPLTKRKIAGGCRKKWVFLNFFPPICRLRMINLIRRDKKMTKLCKMKENKRERTVEDESEIRKW